MSSETSAANRWDPRVFDRLLQGARKAPVRAEVWMHLEAAHVVGQTRFWPHLGVHCHMLTLAWRERDWQEMFGQVFRIALVPLGHLFRRLPLGNTGRAQVSVFKPMAVRPELAALIDRARHP